MANVVLVFHEIDIIPRLNNNGIWQHVLLLAIVIRGDEGVSVGSHLTLLILTVTDGIDKKPCLLDNHLFSTSSDDLFAVICGDLRRFAALRKTTQRR